MAFDLFQSTVPLGRIKSEDLRRARVDLQVARNTSRQNLAKYEDQKAQLFAKAVAEKSKEMRTSYLSEIATLGFKIRLERAVLQGFERQLRLVSVAEAVKDFQNRKVQSPVLQKLANIRMADLEKALSDMLREGMTADEVTKEIVGRLEGGLPFEADQEIRELERLIEQAQATAGAEADLQALAQKINEEHNRMLERPQPAGL
jgi:hypothetical protein